MWREKGERNKVDTVEGTEEKSRNERGRNTADTHFLFLSFARPSGEIFKVPTHSVHIPTPAVGEIVTFSYDNLARRNIPVNPEIFRKRPDVRWEEVVLNSQAHHVQGILLIFLFSFSFAHFYIFIFRVAE